MISIFRKNLSSSALNPKSSFPCNSNLQFFLSTQIHSFSTSRIKRRIIIPNPQICDVLVNKHQFSPELASLASSSLPNYRSPETADSVLTFLKEYSFTTAQLEKIVVYNPRILGFTIDGLKFRFNVFQDLGLSPLDIAKIMSIGKSIFHLNVEKKILPKISILKSLLGSNQEVARLLKRSGWFLSSDLERTLLPNVEVLKSCGIPMELILSFLWIQPRCFLIKPVIMRKSVDRTIEMGVSQTCTHFIHAASVLSYTSEGNFQLA